ncbi:MAG: FAD-dependent oxidoreductase [Planctomycetales bacterium]|nr:FAD-dependent oxidoreductase [Planctomycetales bacterium]
MRVVIVGGVAGGASAAARLRRLDEQAEIIVCERGAHPSFANCGMPYYIGGVIPQREKLLVAPLALLQNRFRLDVRTRTEVVSIDRTERTVAVRNLESGEETTLAYDRLILAPGAVPLRPPIPGIDSPGIYSLRDLNDADRLQAVAQSGAAVVIVGGGFIGVELAENFVERGLNVTLVELADQILAPWDREMTAPLAAKLREKGVELVLGASAESFAAHSEKAGIRVQLNNGQSIDCDFVTLCIGVRPENQLAKAAGLAIGPRGGIRTNVNMQTDDPLIYAVGDAVEVVEFVSGQPTQIPLAGPANRQGRIAADHIAGRDSTFRGTQGTSVVGAFGMTAAMTGLSEKVLQRLGYDYQKVYVHPAHHAGYYPGSTPMTLKLLFEPKSGKLWGAQGVGQLGVDKRIDVLAMAVQAGMSVYDLEEAELCYAPQYGSAKDPVNMLGFVAAGVARDDHPVVNVSQLEETPFADAFLLDVRTPAEFAAGHLPGAVNIPVDELRGRLSELPQQQSIIAYCKVGQRGYIATRILKQHGFSVHNLSGGYTTWCMFRA